MVLDSASSASPTPPLRRERSGRWLAGVCQGLAKRWDLNVAQVRALFVLASVLGGLGVLAYVACWLVLPLDAGGADSPSLVRGMASLALLAAALAGLATVAAAASATTLFGFGWLVAVAAAVFLVAALVAWPTVRPAWALAVLAAALVPAVAVAASGVRIAPETGVEVATPSAPADVEGGYRSGIGDLLVDLRHFRAPAGSVVPLRIEAGRGHTVVALPRTRCFNLDVRYRTRRGWPLTQPLARSITPGASFYGGWRPGSGHWRRASSDPRAPTLRIDYTAVAGWLTVRDYPDSTGPLFEPYWPINVRSPASPGERRWAWRVTVKKRSVQRRWRAWRKESKRFAHTFAALQAGACARHSAAR